MEHIHIISKEVITQPLQLPLHIIAAITISLLVGALIYLFKNSYKGYVNFKVVEFIAITGIAGITAMLVSMIICSIFFKVPTDRYIYTATVDKENITVAEYEEFIETYKPNIVDGIYYWEGE